MKQFYEHIRVDAEKLRFYIRCEICGKKQYGEKIPVICRNVRTLLRCTEGRANKISQAVFNHTKANATQLLAMHFNQCRHCYRWVCDDCYDITDSKGICIECSHK